ncbi:MAG: CcmD family protein [Bdellovibrionales bacterium]|nr:CcmD family protein [Bdellovibrionales bacterium]
METPNTYWDLFLGYSAIWALFVVYLVRLRMEQARLLRRLEELSAQS